MQDFFFISLHFLKIAFDKKKNRNCLRWENLTSVIEIKKRRHFMLKYNEMAVDDSIWSICKLKIHKLIVCYLARVREVQWELFFLLGGRGSGKKPWKVLDELFFIKKLFCCCYILPLHCLEIQFKILHNKNCLIHEYWGRWEFRQLRLDMKCSYQCSEFLEFIPPRQQDLKLNSIASVENSSRWKHKKWRRRSVVNL